MGLTVEQTRQHRICRMEFEDVLQNSDATRALQSVGVDVLALMDVSEFVFKNGFIEFNDFMDLLMQLRGGNNATVRDVVDLRSVLIEKVDGLEDKILARIARHSKLV